MSAGCHVKSPDPKTTEIGMVGRSFFSEWFSAELQKVLVEKGVLKEGKHRWVSCDKPIPTAWLCDKLQIFRRNLKGPFVYDVNRIDPAVMAKTGMTGGFCYPEEVVTQKELEVRVISEYSADSGCDYALSAANPRDTFSPDLEDSYCSDTDESCTEDGGVVTGPGTPKVSPAGVTDRLCEGGAGPVAMTFAQMKYRAELEGKEASTSLEA